MTRRESGFSLVELVAGMTVMALAFTYMQVVMFQQFENSVDPMFKVRSVELGQAYISEILGKSFDENSISGGRCSDGGLTCTTSGNLGPEAGEGRTTYDDVDDFNGLDSNPGGPKDALGNLRADFSRYRVQISVVYDNDYNGTTDTNTLYQAKLIKVTVTDPRGDTLDYAVYKGNY